MNEKERVEATAMLPKDDKEKLIVMCNIFSGKISGNARFKNVVKKEIDREKEVKEIMEKSHQLMAFGRRSYER